MAHTNKITKKGKRAAIKAILSTGTPHRMKYYVRRVSMEIGTIVTPYDITSALRNMSSAGQVAFAFTETGAIIGNVA